MPVSPTGGWQCSGLSREDATLLVLLEKPRKKEKIWIFTRFSALFEHQGCADTNCCPVVSSWDITGPGQHELSLQEHRCRDSHTRQSSGSRQAFAVTPCQLRELGELTSLVVEPFGSTSLMPEKFGKRRHFKVRK